VVSPRRHHDRAGRVLTAPPQVGRRVAISSSRGTAPSTRHGPASRSVSTVTRVELRVADRDLRAGAGACAFSRFMCSWPTSVIRALDQHRREVRAGRVPWTTPSRTLHSARRSIRSVQSVQPFQKRRSAGKTSRCGAGEAGPDAAAPAGQRRLLRWSSTTRTLTPGGTEERLVAAPLDADDLDVVACREIAGDVQARAHRAALPCALAIRIVIFNRSPAAGPGRWSPTATEQRTRRGGGDRWMAISCGQHDATARFWRRLRGALRALRAGPCGRRGDSGRCRRGETARPGRQLELAPRKTYAWRLSRTSSRWRPSRSSSPSASRGTSPRTQAPRDRSRAASRRAAAPGSGRPRARPARVPPGDPRGARHDLGRGGRRIDAEQRPAMDIGPRRRRRSARLRMRCSRCRTAHVPAGSQKLSERVL